MCNRQQVQHRVGGTAHRHRHSDRVLECFARQNLARQYLFPDRIHQHFGGFRRALGFFQILRCHRGRIHQAQTHRLDDRGHRVRGIHAAARSRAGAGVALYLHQLFLVDLVCRVLPHRFECADDGQVATFVVTGLDGAAIDEYGRDVQTRHGDHRARHILVAAADGEHTVHALAVAYRLDRIGDHLARHQRIFHAFGAHRDAVRNRDRAEQLRHRAGLFQGSFSAQRQCPDAHVAGCDGAVGIRNTDDGLIEIPVAKAHRAQQGTVGRALHALGDSFAFAVV